MAPGEIAGFQATVFRISPPAGPLPASGNRPANASWLIVHAGLSDFRDRSFAHRSWAIRERAGTGISSARTDDTRLDISVPGLRATMPDDRRNRFVLSFDLPPDAQRITLELESVKPVTLHGKGGYSTKGPCPTCASHYTSFSRLAGSFDVSPAGDLPARGKAAAWYDHEFGSQSIDPAQTGWDWFSIQLDQPEEEIMLFQVRATDAAKSWRAGTWIDRTGIAHDLDGVSFTPEGSWKSPRSGGSYPASWTVSIPSRKTKLDIVPRFPDQEAVSKSRESAMPTYWEGSCEVFEHGTRKRAGRAYLEMTGYAPGSTPRF